LRLADYLQAPINETNLKLKNNDSRPTPTSVPKLPNLEKVFQKNEPLTPNNCRNFVSEKKARYTALSPQKTQNEQPSFLLQDIKQGK